MSDRIARGGCLCGAVSFEFTLPSLFAAHCHCTMCQRAHGAGFVTWIGVKEDGFRITQGADAIVHYRSSEHVTRSFCGACGSTMLCNSDLHDNVIDIALANVAGRIDRAPSSHIYYDCRAGWIEIDDALKKRGGEGGTQLLEPAS